MAPLLKLDSGSDFPPLDGKQQMSKKKKCHVQNGDDAIDSIVATGSKPSLDGGAAEIANRPVACSDSPSPSYGESFVSCRVGSKLNDYRADLRKILDERNVGTVGDFILTPIAPIRSNQYDGDSFDVAPDFILPLHEWAERVAIDLGQPCLDFFDPAMSRHFDKLFRHALYLGSSAIVISCPDSDIAQASCASIINNRLRNYALGPLVLLRVAMNSRQYGSTPSSWYSSSPSSSSNSSGIKSKNGRNPVDSNQRNTYSRNAQLDCSTSCSLSEDDEKPLIQKNYALQQHYEEDCPWRQWNSIRSHLVPDKKIGVCLHIRDDISCSQEELDRWTGEPVRMVIINVDQFVRMPGVNTGLRLSSRCKEFITRIMLANSLKTALVIEGRTDEDLLEYMQYLDDLIREVQSANPDPLRGWHDKIQPPLQPLSCNLDSSIYACFETDLKKYLQYRDSMIQALDRLLILNQNETEERRTFVLMVLGAGRGPLVDSFIDAIRTVNSKHKFKIYALDKNPSSIRSLRYKQAHNWLDRSGNDMYETEIVESDMRNWKPASELKADIIATELLGSLGDNELSPECIDGVWAISGPRTISIPQEYSSYLAPICSFRLFQELSWLKTTDKNVFDQIYVSKLSNYYLISEPQQLFTFEHRNLNIPPERKCNQRFRKLTFRCKTETVCHGFAGYFTAHLFGTTHISTVEGRSTPNMDSWFPAFIPLEQPIHLTKNDRIELLFWRKESLTDVWYEWTISRPIKSRIYSQSGINTSMSKFIE